MPKIQIVDMIVMNVSVVKQTQVKSMLQVCSSDRIRIVDSAQVLAMARLVAWTPWENSVVVLGGEGGGGGEEGRGDFGRWLPTLLTMAWRLADLLKHTSAPEKLKEPTRTHSLLNPRIHTCSKSQFSSTSLETAGLDF